MTGSQGSPFAKVRSVRAHEQIVEQLQQLILSGKLATGARLPSERAMMTEFHVSRPTVREALRVAESMGLISVRPGDPGGPKVLGTPSVGITRVFDSLLQAGCSSAFDLLEMRIVLDSSAAALASLQPRERLANLSEVLRQMQATTDLNSFAELDAKFHEAVIVASGNRLFHLIFQALDQPIRALIQSSLESPQHQGREETLQQHGAILDAIQKGNAHRAASAVRKHLCEFYFPFLSAPERRRIKAFSKTMEQPA
jgi:GntR family transcriptional regulator, transcriptional repressor for pyruvate dehydrogenase complex